MTTLNLLGLLALTLFATGLVFWAKVKDPLIITEPEAWGEYTFDPPIDATRETTSARICTCNREPMGA